MQGYTFSFLDLETSGTNPWNDRVIEVGILKVKDGEIVGKMDTLVNPERTVSSFTENFINVSNEELKQAPIFEKLVPEINDLIKDTIIVAHNARFDYSFMQGEYSRLEMPFEYPHTCSVKLSRKLYPQHRRHNLDEIINRFNIVCENRHRALADAEVIYHFFCSAYKEKSRLEVDRAINDSSNNLHLLTTGQLTFS